MKINPVGAELFHAEGETGGRTDGRTDVRRDITKLTVPFRNFANVERKYKRCVGRKVITLLILNIDTTWG